MPNKIPSNESPVKNQRMADLQRIKKIALQVEALTNTLERHAAELSEVCVELHEEYRAVEKSLVDNAQRELKFSDIYTPTFPSTIVDDSIALLKVVADKDSWHHISRHFFGCTH